MQKSKAQEKDKQEYQASVDDKQETKRHADPMQDPHAKDSQDFQTP
jgi:hypothetical protein